MSHVLLGGDERKMAALRVLLTKWGVTVGALAFTDANPTVHDCDAVILLGKCDEYRDTCLGSLPDGSGGAAGPAAPLIFIQGGRRLGAELPAAWMVLWQLDDDGGNLRAVLMSAFATARALREVSASSAARSDRIESDGFLHFLGHELRSPLTAIKTSLEVLEGELGWKQRGSDSTQKMLAIALRNVRRLHRTVEWSQGLLAAGDVVDTFAPCVVAAPELAARLRPVGNVCVTDAACELALQTDPEVLATVVTQMARAVSMVVPNCELTIQMDLSAAEMDQFQLMVGADVDRRAEAVATPERPGLVGSAAVDGPVGELERLAHFLVAPGLVEVLGASLETVSSVGYGPALILSLDLAPQQISV